MARDYKKEYREYHAKPEQRARRSSRNKARRLMIKSKGAGALKGREVHHKNHNATDNRKSNLAIMSKSQNRKIQPKRKK